MGNCCGSSATVPSESGLAPKTQVEDPRSQNTSQSTHPGSKHLSAASSQTLYVVSSPNGNGEKHADPTVHVPRRRETTPTTSHKPRAVRPERVRSQDFESALRNRDGADHLPASGDVPAARDPRRQETFSRTQRARLHPPGEMSRTKSDNPLVNGHSTQPGSLQVPGTNSAPVEKQGPPRFRPTLQGLLPKDFRFRLLVVGKRDSGKSSLIRSIFKVDMLGSPINVSGRTAEFRPPDNHHLVVHECPAFGPGEIQVIQNFITTRNNKSRPASERLHAIWICIPMSDVINGQVDEGLRLLLGTGVPLVIVFTKFDLVSSSHDYESRCRSLFRNVPAEIVSTQERFRNRINKLVVTTDGVIIAHSRNITALSEAQRTQPRLFPVSLSWSVSQRASRDTNIQASIEVGSRYWRRLWSSDDFVGQTSEKCVGVIHADIVGTWNLPDRDKYLSNIAFKAVISYLVQDLTGSPIHTSSRHRLGGTPVSGAPWLNGRHENSKEKISLVMGYIVDLTLILCGIFGSHSNVTPNGVQSVIDDFAGSTHKATIHSEILSFIDGVPQFEHGDNDVVTGKIRDLISRNCDPPPAVPTYA